MSKLVEKNDIYWEETLLQLKTVLPQDMPITERKSMLKLKNANLIRMFDSYKTFSDSAQHIIKQMEQKDYAIADQLKVIRAQNDSIEQKIDSLIMLIPVDSVERIQKEVFEFKNKAC